jgi:hypothetical protein
MRLSAAVAVIFAFGTSCIAQDFARSWYPLQSGNSWTYRNESLSGDMAHPDFERWTTEETIVSTVPDSKLAGILVTKRTKVLNDVLSPDFIAGQKSFPDSQLLIRRNCVYDLGFRVYEPGRPDRRNDLLRGELPPDYCFPFAKGTTWGRMPTTSPANEYVWYVVGFNDDPFGKPGGRTFHFTSHGGSGTSLDRWFEEGVGLVQEVDEHHGTYDEDRRQLVKSTLNGKTQSYQLKPARTGLLSEDDCGGPGWRHFSRADGTGFGSIADCRSYVRGRR